MGPSLLQRLLLLRLPILIVRHALLLPRNVVRLPGGCNLVQILHRLLLILGRGIADRH